jgi:LPS sulfotransferase NodH
MIFWRGQVRPFVVLFEGRSGSTFLLDALASHPHIQARKEVMADLRRQGVAPTTQLAAAARLLSPAWLGPYRAIGFKSKLGDLLDRDAFAELLRARQVYVIYLRRQNQIKAVVSAFRGQALKQASGGWNLYDQAQRLPPLTIEPATFDRWLQEREQREAALAAYVADLGRPTLPLHYEALLIGPEALFAEALAFLGVRPQTLRPRTLKHTSDDLSRALANFDELRRAYAGTPYEAMFNEVLIAETG